MDVEDSLIEWVTLKQLNSNGLKTNLKSISQLSNGIFLSELMVQVSQEHFQLDFITYDTQENWALKLSNLRRLKKSIDSYIDQVLGIPREQYDSIDLPTIARRGSIQEILKLLQLVIYTIVNCPNKHTFITRIMDLDQICQTHLMVFIQKVMENHQDVEVEDWLKSADQVTIKRVDYQSIRNQQKHLNEQLVTAREEIENLKTQNQKLIKDKEELKAVNADLQKDLKQRHQKQRFTQRPSLSIELECQLAQYQIQISQMQNFQTVLKRQHEAEIEQLRDELDISQSKLFKMNQLESTIENYRKRLEKVADQKKLLQEAEENCEIYKSQLKECQAEMKEIQDYKSYAQKYKAELLKQKEKSENLKVLIECKEKQIKKQSKQIDQLEKVETHLNNRIFELEHQDEDSKSSSSQKKSDSQVQQKVPVVQNIRRVARAQTNINAASAIQQVLKAREAAVSTKQLLREQIQRKEMFVEEVSAIITKNSETILCLQADNIQLTKEIDSLNQQLTKHKEWKLKKTQLKYDYQQLKQYKNTLTKQLQTTSAEKEQLYSRVSQTLNQKNQLQNQLTIKLHQLNFYTNKTRELQLSLNKYQQQKEFTLPVIPESGEEDWEQKYSELQSNVNILQIKLTGALGELAAKEKLIDELKQHYETVLKSQQEELEEKQVQMKAEHDLKVQRIILETEEALNLLNNDREKLACRLGAQTRKGSLQRRMTFVDYKGGLDQELTKFRSESLRKDKNIQYLLNANSELKKAWNDTVRMLNLVCREMGSQTLKMERAMSRRETISHTQAMFK